MIVRVFVYSILVFYSNYCFSQKFINLKTYDVDSILLILPEQQGKERVNSLNRLAVSLSFVDYDLSTKYADEAMDLANEFIYDEGVAEANRNLGHIYFYQGNYPKALNNYFEALSLYEKLKKKHKVGGIYLDISRTHYFANNFEKAMEYCNTSMDIFQERKADGTLVGTVRDSVNFFGGATEVYWKMGMLDKSLEYGLKTVEILKRNNFSNIEVMINTWSLGAAFADVGELDSAKAYFLKALSYPDESIDMKTLKYRNITTLGWLNYSIGEIDSALYYLKSAFSYYNETGFLFWAMSTSQGLGYIYFKNEKLNSAEKYLQQSERIFNEMLAKDSWYRNDSLKYIANYGLELYFPLPPVRLKEMMWDDGKSLYKLLYRFNTEINKTDEALKYHIAYSNAKDTLNKLQGARETIEIQTRYESDRKDQQIDYLSKENEFKDIQLNQSKIISFGLAGLVLLIVILAIVLIRQNKLREQQKNLLIQQKLFRSQMNPHFIFNSLASIQNSIINEEPIKASKYLSRFSKLVRNILDSSVEESIPLEEEISQQLKITSNCRKSVSLRSLIILLKWIKTLIRRVSYTTHAGTAVY